MVFEWDRHNIAHIRRHRVQPAEAEQVLRNDPILVDQQTFEGEDRWLVLGETLRGRLLVVVYTERDDAYRVVTAYPMTPRLKDVYWRERGL